MAKDLKLSDGKIVKMREPKVRDMKIAGESSSAVDQEIMLIGNLTGLTPDEVDDLTLKDYGILQEGLKTFL